MFITIGTTAETIANHLLTKRLQVITNGYAFMTSYTQIHHLMC
ncbi:hypothetical protein O9929_12250 [Vibrio lentus]|nr:hypothetical protein [Vibrio lentus]